MNQLKASLKFVQFTMALASYFTTAIFVNIFSTNKEKHLQYVVSFYCKLALKIFNVKLTTNLYKKEVKGTLLVSNHLSYLDIIAISSLIPTNFITSTDIERTPVLGHICKLASCIFVDRRGRMNRSNELSKISNRLLSGENIVIFPEATSTNGEKIIPFKKGLFEAVIQKDLLISSLCVQYLRINNFPVTRENRDIVCWYGDMDFLPHLWRLLQQTEIVMNLNYIEEFFGLSFDNTSDLVSDIEQSIRSSYCPIERHS